MKYIIALIASLVILLAYAFIGSAVFGWRHSGGIIPQLILWATIIFVWKKIVAKWPQKETVSSNTVSSACNADSDTTPSAPPPEKGATLSRLTDRIFPAVQTDQEPQDMRTPIVCSACETENASHARFCESCGISFYRECPGCRNSNRVDKKYCAKCGADLVGLSQLKEALGDIEKLFSNGDYERAIQEIEKYSSCQTGEAKGQKLDRRIRDIEKWSRFQIEQRKKEEEEIRTLLSNNTAPDYAHDKKLFDKMRSLKMRLGGLPEDLVGEKEDVDKRIETGRGKRKRKVQIAGVVYLLVLMVLGLTYRKFLTTLYYRTAFTNAVESCQTEKALALAEKLGDRYDTVDALAALKDFNQAKEQYTRVVADAVWLNKYYTVRSEVRNAVNRAAYGSKNLLDRTESYNRAREIIEETAVQIEDVRIAKESFRKALLDVGPQLESLSGSPTDDWDLMWEKKRLIAQYAPDEWASMEKAERIARIESSLAEKAESYRKAKACLQRIIEKTPPAIVQVSCTAKSFSVFEDRQRLSVDEGKVSVSAFSEHTLEFRSDGYHSETVVVPSLGPNRWKTLSTVFLRKIVCPPGGDPAAFDWEVINDRWIKNIYEFKYMYSDVVVTITDKVEGKMWVDSPYSLQRSWRDAVTYCDNLTFAGHSDWYLPDKKNLQNQAHYKNLFNGIETGHFYWSRTKGDFDEYSRSKHGAWKVDMSDGSSKCVKPEYEFNYVWPARDIQ